MLCCPQRCVCGVPLLVELRIDRNWKYLDTMNVCVSRAFYLCFFTLNFGVTRVMWYAVPEHVAPS